MQGQYLEGESDERESKSKKHSYLEFFPQKGEFLHAS